LFTERSCPTDDGILTSAIAQALLDGRRDFRPYLLEAVRRTERSTAQPSHCHPEGIKGAQCTALSIWVARHTRDPAAVRAAAMRFYTELPTWDFIQKNHRYNETCQGCVPDCVTLATECESFEETIRAACSIRGDADTLATIAGSISQALHGVPDDIRRETIARTEPHYPWLAQTLSDFEARYGA
jgi:ADP-ribosylglycohydrolase